jgi:hypothetical protein
MAQLVRLRIELADTPGSLATVAGVIAGMGGNITAVDVQGGRPATAVDEIVVDFPDEVELGRVREVIADSGAATLLSQQSAKRVDPVVELLQSPATPPEEAVTAALADLFSSPAVWVSTAEEAKEHEAGRFALKEHGAVTVRSQEVPAPLRAALPEGEVWLLAVPDLELEGRSRVVFVARPLELAFTATEISRIEALTTLYDELARLRTAAGGAAPAG